MAILEKYEALTFRMPMARGMTKPFLVSAVPEGGGEAVDLVVKPRAGYADRQDAIYKEIFSAILARELGVFTPTSVIVNLPEGLEFGAEDYPDSKAMIEQSYGLNYATVFLGSDWKTWTNGANPSSLRQDSIQSSFCFDALVQNADRKVDNPNLMWKGDQLATLDFDRAFFYGGQQIKEVIPMLQVEQHVLCSHVKAVDGKLIGEDLWSSWEEWNYSNPLESMLKIDGLEAPLKNIDDSALSNMLQYLKEFDRDPETFFGYLTHLSQ
jgi:hypothetical protein